MLGLLIPLAILATVAVLVIGLGGFARGGEFNKKYGNKLMQMRILFQFVAVFLIIVTVVIAKS